MRVINEFISHDMSNKLYFTINKVLAKEHSYLYKKIAICTNFDFKLSLEYYLHEKAHVRVYVRRENGPIIEF